MANTVVVAGGNLFAIAAQYLGDATQAYRIAQRNGLRDFFLSPNAPITLTLPPIDLSQNTGIPQT